LSEIHSTTACWWAEKVGETHTDGAVSIIDERASSFTNYMTHLSDFCDHLVVVENDLRYIVGSQFGFLVYKTL
jgi:hypothetical protein